MCVENAQVILCYLKVSQPFQGWLPVNSKLTQSHYLAPTICELVSLLEWEP